MKCRKIKGGGKIVFVQSDEKKEENKNILTKKKKFDMTKERVSVR